MPRTRHGSQDQRHMGCFAKTKLCKFHLMGSCTRGRQCQFAHGQEEVQPLPNFTRTKLCKALRETGVCEDKKCLYAHSIEELRSSAHLLFRTKMCHFHRMGHCSLGSRCNFAHSVEELQESPALTDRSTSLVSCSSASTASGLSYSPQPRGTAISMAPPGCDPGDVGDVHDGGPGPVDFTLPPAVAPGAASAFGSPAWVPGLLQPSQESATSGSMRVGGKVGGDPDDGPTVDSVLGAYASAALGAGFPGYPDGPVTQKKDDPIYLRPLEVEEDLPTACGLGDPGMLSLPSADEAGDLGVSIMDLHMSRRGPFPGDVMQLRQLPGQQSLQEVHLHQLPHAPDRGRYALDDHVQMNSPVSVSGDEATGRMLPNIADQDTTMGFEQSLQHLPQEKRQLVEAAVAQGEKYFELLAELSELGKGQFADLSASLRGQIARRLQEGGASPANMLAPSLDVGETSSAAAVVAAAAAAAGAKGQPQPSRSAAPSAGGNPRTSMDAKGGSKDARRSSFPFAVPEEVVSQTDMLWQPDEWQVKNTFLSYTPRRPMIRSVRTAEAALYTLAEDQEDAKEAVT